MRLSLLAPVVALALVSLTRPARAVDYGAKGAIPSTTTDLPSGTAGTTGSKLVVPAGAGPFPVLVASHGFSAAPANQLGWAEHFASYGFVVAVPAFPSPFNPNTATNAAVIEAMVAYARANVASADPTRFGLEGHSAGGLATTVAAAKLSPQAVVLFDPVDRNNDGKTAYGTLCSPVLALFAQAGVCNNQAGWRAFASTTPGPLVAANVVGATHCDGENAARGLCALGCLSAGADTARQRVHAHYATAFFLARLQGDAAAEAELTSAALAANAALASPVVRAGTPCAVSPVDAGADVVVPPVDAGSDGGPASDAGSTSDAGPIDDAGPARDSGPVPAPDGAAPPPSPTIPPGPPAGPVDSGPAASPTPAVEGDLEGGGCGCHTPARRADAGAIALLALVAGALVSRRRR